MEQHRIRSYYGGIVTEPVYVFEKGKGWVIEQNTPYPDDKGKLWYLELRKPSPGEYCCWVFGTDNWGLEDWIVWLQATGVSPYPYESLSSRIGDRDLAWCTFIPVNP